MRFIDNLKLAKSCRAWKMHQNN